MAKSSKKYINLQFSFIKIKPLWLTLRINLLPLALFILLATLSFFTYQIIFLDKFYPRTILGDLDVTFLTKGQASLLLAAQFDKKRAQKIKFYSAQNNFSIDLSKSSANLDYSVIDQAFQTGHVGSLPQRLNYQIQALFFKKIIYPKITIDLDKQIGTITQIINQPPQNAQLNYNETQNLEGSPSATIQIKEGINGLELDKEALLNEVKNFLILNQYRNGLPLKIVPPKITTNHVTQAKNALEQSLTKPIRLVFEDKSFTLDTKQLLTILDLESGSDLLLDKDKTFLFLENIRKDLDQEVQEGLFEFNIQTKRVTAFKPSQPGQKLDVDRTYQLLTEALTNPQRRNISLPVAKTLPKIQTSDVNSLGIKELLGRGISYFTGSIPNRIYNISLAASRINGILIPPGEIFSFNDAVGDISQASGYKPAYVMKSGRTVLDDGGGVCQDSTTLFRAVLNAGLPTIQRVAHAYRVGYYEQGFPPGLDATVFAPSVDFKFKNDTSSHVLIQAYTLGTTLYVDLYGTSDGRVVEISKSTVTNQTSPPPELRQDDPNLPKGEVKQVDFPAWGANVTFSRTVKRAGEVLIQETFKSNYKAWQAVYLVGTKE